MKALKCSTNYECHSGFKILGNNNWLSTKHWIIFALPTCQCWRDNECLERILWQIKFSQRKWSFERNCKYWSVEYHRIHMLKSCNNIPPLPSWKFKNILICAFLHVDIFCWYNKWKWLLSNRYSFPKLPRVRQRGWSTGQHDTGNLYDAEFFYKGHWVICLRSYLHGIRNPVTR